MVERWRPVVGFEGLYEVSDQGRVRSLARIVPRANGRTYRVSGRILKPGSKRFKPGGRRNSPDRRQSVLLHHTDGTQKSRYVHYLVLEAFVGPRPPGKWCCHYNDDSTDNRLENLRWDTPSANRHDQVRNGVDYNSRKTHCKYGHEFTPENTIRNGVNGRNCRECQRRANREAQRVKRAQPRAEDTCGQCGRKRESDQFKLCDRCRKYRRERSRAATAWFATKRQAGK